MKTRTVLCAMLALVLALSPMAWAQAGNRESIPAPNGIYSETVQGTLAVCLNPTTFAEEACTTKGALAYGLTDTATGYVTADAKTGDFCETTTTVIAALPPNTTPSSISINPPGGTAGKVTNYDPATRSGDETFTSYHGGKCIGAVFDKAGATVSSTGTAHFVMSEHGNRYDALLTSLHDPIGGLASVSITVIRRR